MVKRANVKLRPIRMSKLEDELKIVQEVYNSTLERNWGFIPVTMDELLATADDMRAFADPEMMLIAEVNGENAGVALSLPNFNEILARVKKTPPLLRLPHILWLMKTHRIDLVRQAVLGISPRFRDRGLHALVALRAVCLCQATILQCDARLDRGKQQRDHRDLRHGRWDSTAGVEDL